jgi:cytidine deaminase
MPLSTDQIAVIQAARRAVPGYIPASLVGEILGASGLSIEQLMLDLLPLAQALALPPISNFRVGAVSLGASGDLYFGANFEFRGQALSFTVHAEQAAIAAAIPFGELGIDMLAISAAPCGYCRQFLYELSTAATLKILLPKRPAAPLTSFLPDPFGPGDLGVTAALMTPQSHGLKLVGDRLEPIASAARLEAVAPVVQAALAAANASYAPYSLSYAGVALQVGAAGKARIYTGSVAENAAYNPSLSPLEAAVVNLIVNGGQSYGDITDAVLVEVPGAAASQRAATEAVLRSITAVPLRTFAALVSTSAS